MSTPPHSEQKWEEKMNIPSVEEALGVFIKSVPYVLLRTSEGKLCIKIL